MKRNSKTKEASLSEELPYWEFLDEPYPHMILTDGSLSAGLRLGQIDIECFDATQVNGLTEMLRSAMNSVSEGIKLQWHLSIDSDFEAMIQAHESGVSNNDQEILNDLEQIRTKRFRKEMDEGALYRPKLCVYLNLQPPSTKKTGLFRSQVEFQQTTREVFEEALSELRENMDSLQSSLESVGLSCRLMDREELIAAVYRHLNPKRSKTEPSPKINQSIDELNLPASVLEESPWLATSSPRAELAFGDLVVDLERFTLDSMLHAVITLKNLPEVTHAGMISSLLRLPFHYDLILTVDVPPQVKEMSKLQAKRRMAHSMSISNGNHAADLENESKLNSTKHRHRSALRIPTTEPLSSCSRFKFLLISLDRKREAWFRMVPLAIATAWLCTGLKHTRRGTNS